MKYYEDYYLGLDIGTNSVGWAVTDPQYNICKFNQKSMWESVYLNRLIQPLIVEWRGQTEEDFREEFKELTYFKIYLKKKFAKLTQHFLSGSMKADYILRTRVKRLHIDIQLFIMPGVLGYWVLWTVSNDFPSQKRVN